MASYVSGHMVNVHVTTREVNGKTVRDASDARKGLVHEGARSLNDEHEQKWAADNPNIRPDFAQQNIVMVQRRDANGDWALTEVDKDGDQDSFLEYGDERVARLERKWRPGEVEVASLAFHLPKSFCIEHPNEAQAIDEKGKKVFDKFGDPVMVSRYTPRDQDEMRAYFKDCLDHLVTKLGSEENIHGAFIHLDERTPHMQVVFDSHQVSEKDPDKLMIAHGRLWGTSRKVVYPEGTIINNKDMSGKRVSGPVKMKRFQKSFREYMADRGWEISREHSENHGTHLTKAEYAQIENARKANEQEIAKIKERTEALDEKYADYEVRVKKLSKREKEVEDKDAQLDRFKANAVRNLANSHQDITHREAVVKRQQEELDKQKAELEEEKKNASANAKQEADNIRAQARRDAQQIRARAEEDAKEKAKEEAKQEAQQIRAKAQQEADSIRAQAEQDAEQTRTDADNYYDSRTSTAHAEVETANGEKTRIEGEISDLREDKVSLTRQKNTLTDEVEKLESRKKRASIGDLVAEPDKLPGAIKTVSRVVNSNIMPLRQAGMKQADLSALQSALGLMQTDSRFQALARENEAKQQSQAEKQQSDILAKRLGLD